MKEIISNTILLILIMDPLGNLPVFMSTLKHFHPKRQRFILIREMFLALIIMFLFLFAGERILNILNLKTETVSISGGLILFLIAIKMIFPSEEIKKNEIIKEEPFLVPLAVPLVAGPSLLATLMLLAHQNHYNTLYLIIALLVAWTFTVIVLLLSEIFLKMMGPGSIIALERLMGLILIMLATQMFLDGIQNWFNF
ncbi:UPF0056 inner membrane protein YhgN [Buchnera aphidicola (Thelaxes suberi)]|uniref:YhgN family NAAT transporter n=1 Tax=Buchnera aphidicola TaxID=9 RepID=UPI003463E5CF